MLPYCGSHGGVRAFTLSDVSYRRRDGGETWICQGEARAYGARRRPHEQDDTVILAGRLGYVRPRREGKGSAAACSARERRKGSGLCRAGPRNEKEKSGGPSGESEGNEGERWAMRERKDGLEPGEREMKRI